MPVEIKRAKRLTTSEFIDSLNRYVNVPYEKIVELSNDTSLPAVDHIMISLVRYAAVGRSTKHVELLLDRLIGPVPKPKEVDVELEHAINITPFERDTDELIIEYGSLTESDG